MASSSSLHSSPFLFIFLSFWVSLFSPAHSQTCSSQKFSGNQIYAHCLDLPSLTSYLHFSYDSANSTLSVAFLASPPSPAGWVSWAINPEAQSMIGSQALIAYKDSKGAMTVKTYNISGLTPATIVQSKLAFDVWDARAEAAGGVVRIFAKLKVPADLAAKGALNHVWQVGPSVSASGAPGVHAMGSANLKSVGSLDLKSGTQTTGGGGGGADSKLRKKNIHGVLNAVSWGFLFPAGIVIARYMRTFESADPAWFYLHVSCQISAYAIGVAGWATGIKLGSESKGITFTTHRNIGITLFALATIQIFALFLRPKKDHKFRIYWNIYHHGVGYAILILGVLNVFKGLDILLPEEKWRSAYIIAIAVLGGIAALLEVITWIVVLKRRSSGKSTKPYDGYNGQQGRQQPFTV